MSLALSCMKTSKANFEQPSKRKQAERASRIVSLPISYHASITPKDHTILAEPIELLVHNVNQRVTKPIDILRTYSKLAISAHQKTNCLTEIMIEEAEEWLSKQNIDSDLPLAGIPVSLKDTIAVGGFDTSVGYSCKTGKPYARDGGLVRLLRDAGKCSVLVESMKYYLLKVTQERFRTSRPTYQHHSYLLSVVMMYDERS